MTRYLKRTFTSIIKDGSNTEEISNFQIEEELDMENLLSENSTINFTVKKIETTTKTENFNTKFNNNNNTTTDKLTNNKNNNMKNVHNSLPESDILPPPPYTPLDPTTNKT